MHPSRQPLALSPELLALGEFAFIDVETTGGNPLADRVTEIAVIRFHADGRQTRWQSLINPSVSIPPAIQTLTGISNAMVRDAPEFFGVREELRALLDGAVFVAHNARFDYGFIKNEFRRVQEQFSADMLCTVRLSRRLYPAERGHGLDALVSRHRLGHFERHRAMGDCEATAAFVQHASEEHSPANVAAAARALLRTPSLPPHLPSDALANIPDGPGVYLFFGVNDLPIYIGKAKHLRERIRSHFSSDHMTMNDARLSRELRRIEWRPTAGEFSALLLESELIKERMPLRNIALRRRERQGFLDLSDDERGLHLEWCAASEAKDVVPDRYGPFTDQAAAKRWLMAAAREHRLCDHQLGFSRPRHAGEPCFARQIGRCHGYCEDSESRDRYRQRLQIALASKRLPAWPFPGATIFEERDIEHDRVDLLAFDQWCSLAGGARLPFDGDVFRLLRQVIERSPEAFRPFA